MTSRKSPTKDELTSMENAVNDYDIRAIHPEKLEQFAAHLVKKLKENESSNLQQD